MTRKRKLQRVIHDDESDDDLLVSRLHGPEAKVQRLGVTEELEKPSPLPEQAKGSVTIPIRLPEQDYTPARYQHVRFLVILLVFPIGSQQDF